MTDFSQARTNMVDGQIHTAGVVDPRILQAFETIPRELFVPEKSQSIAYTDEDIEIGQGRFLLEPITHAKMIQAVQPKKSDIVLDIGIGAGYSSAILSPMVTTIIALETNKRQIDKASRLWNKIGACNIALIEGKLENGVPDQAPYSLIVINGAVSEVPETVLNQMETNGRLITIVKKPGQPIGRATLFMKSKSGTISSKPLFDAAVPFLKGFEPKPQFEF